MDISARKIHDRYPLFIQSVSCNLRGVNSFQTIFIFRFVLYDIDITTFMTDIFNY